MCPTGTPSTGGLPGWRSSRPPQVGVHGPHRQAVNLRPSAGWPDRAVVAVDLARVRAVIDRIAADVDELARARRPRT